MRIFSYLIWSLFVFAVAVLLKEVPNGFAAEEDDPATVKIAVLDPQKAASLFKEFTRHAEIPFKYPIDGCYARATAMAQIAEKDNIQLGKVYAQGFLQVKNEGSEKYPYVQWGWHVAPVAYVKLRNGKTELTVFDPSLFPKPVTVEEWKQKMMDASNGLQPRAEIYYGARYQYYPKNHEGNKASWIPTDLENLKTTFEKYMPLQDLPGSSMKAASGKPNEGTK